MNAAAQVETTSSRPEVGEVYSGAAEENLKQLRNHEALNLEGRGLTHIPSAYLRGFPASNIRWRCWKHLRHAGLWPSRGGV